MLASLSVVRPGRRTDKWLFVRFAWKTECPGEGQECVMMAVQDAGQKSIAVAIQFLCIMSGNTITLSAMNAVRHLCSFARRVVGVILSIRKLFQTRSIPDHDYVNVTVRKRERMKQEAKGGPLGMRIWNRDLTCLSILWGNRHQGPA